MNNVFNIPETLERITTATSLLNTKETFISFGKTSSLFIEIEMKNAIPCFILNLQDFKNILQAN